VKKKIICVSPNTNIERTWVVPGLHLGGVFHVQQEVLLASGKGINVARGVHLLGQTAMCMGFIAGHIGRLIDDLAQREGLECDWTWVQGESREAFALVDPQAGGGDATLISGQGPQITAADWQRLASTVLEQSRWADLVCFSGSFPPGSPLEAFTQLILRLRDTGKTVWIDCSRDVLQAALEGRPNGIKINSHEAGDLVGFTVSNLETAVRVATRLREQGIEQVVLTMGVQGAIMVDGASAWRVSAAELPGVLSTVGSGDAFLAGLLVGLSKGEDLPAALRSAAAAGGANVLTLGGGNFTPQDFEQAYRSVHLRRIDGSPAYE